MPKRNLSFTWPDLPRFPEMSDNWIIFFKEVDAKEKKERKKEFAACIISWFFIIYFIFYFWLFWVFVAACGLALVAASGHYSLVAEHEL